MYAVVKTGGKQLKVEKDGTAVVEKLDAAVGDKIELPVLFVTDGDKTLVSEQDLAGATVTAEIVEHFKDDKVIVFKFKKRKGYKRTKGHRQEKTRLLITDISVGGKPAKAKAGKAVEAEPKKTAAKTETAEKPETAAKKPAARKTAAKAETTEKPAAKAKTAAAKPAAKKTAAKAEAGEKPAEEKKTPAKKPAAKKKTEAE